MPNSAYGSGLSLDALMVPVQAATVYAAQEQSLYLPGTLIPMVDVPAGSASAQVAVMGSVTATTITAVEEVAPGADLETVLPTDAKKSIDLELIAARTVLRDFGGVDVNDMGRIMGNSIAAAVDTKISAEFANLTQQEIVPATGDILDEFFKAVGAIRNAGEMGPLAAVVSAAAYAEFMKIIGSDAYAAADVQNAAMRSGALGTIAGVPCFVSAHLNDTNTGVTGTKAAIFGQEALRGATQGGVKLEVERRAAAVGNDVVSSIAFGIETLDATRGILLKDAA
jgi:hypothetical protein